MNSNQTNPLSDVELEVIRASEITPKEIKWLWYPYIPFGKVTLLQGDPGDGKSKLMLALSATLSRGKPLPFTDESEAHEPMTIIYQTTEDDADDTVVPRFTASAGDRDRLIFISEKKKNLTFGDNRIREAIEKYKAGLLILDPLSSYIGDSCSLNAASCDHSTYEQISGYFAALSHLRFDRYCRIGTKYFGDCTNEKSRKPERKSDGSGEVKSRADRLCDSL